MENLFLFDLMDGNITQTSLGMVFKNLKGWNWNLKIFYKQQIQFNIIEVFSWKTTSHECASTDFSPKNKEMNFRNLDQEQHTQESNTQAYRVMLAMEMQVGLKSKETKYRTESIRVSAAYALIFSANQLYLLSWLKCLKIYHFLNPII